MEFVFCLRSTMMVIMTSKYLIVSITLPYVLFWRPYQKRFGSYRAASHRKQKKKAVLKRGFFSFLSAKRVLPLKRWKRHGCKSIESEVNIYRGTLHMNEIRKKLVIPFSAISNVFLATSSLLGIFRLLCCIHVYFQISAFSLQNRSLKKERKLSSYLAFTLPTVVEILCINLKL